MLSIPTVNAFVINDVLQLSSSAILSVVWMDDYPDATLDYLSKLKELPNVG